MVNINDIKTFFCDLDLSKHLSQEVICFDGIEYQSHYVIYYEPNENKTIDIVPPHLNEVISNNIIYYDKFACFYLLVYNNKRYMLSCASIGSKIYDLNKPANRCCVPHNIRD